MSIARGALLLAVAVAGCRPDPGPQPVAPDPGPPPPVTVAEPALPPSETPTVSSWTPLLRLVPKAGFVMGADVAKLRMSAVWAEQIDRLGKSSEVQAAVEAARACGLELRDVRRVVVAGNVEGEAGTSVLFAVEAPRIGERATLDCVMTSSKKKSEWKGSALVFDDGAKHALPQSPDVVVIVEKSLLPRVEEAIATGRATPDPEIGFLLDRVDLGAGAWAVSAMPKGGSPPFDQIKNIAVTFDTTVGLSVAAWLGVDASQVERVREELQRQFESLQATLPALGLPEAVTRSITFSAVGDGVVVHMRATEPELRAAIEKIAPVL